MSTVTDWLPRCSNTTVRSASAGDFVSVATCVETDGADTTTTDAAAPPSGAVHHYLVRAVNDCPGGDGSLGLTSQGAERPGTPCP